MAKKFLTGLNLVVLDVDPATGSEGELYFNSSASVAKIYQAGSWSVLGAGGGGTTVSTTEPSSPEIGDSWYKNDTGEFYIYDGTYWVEVNGVIASESFKTISVSGQSDVVADSNTDTLTLVAGTNVSITTNATNDSITINADSKSTSSVYLVRNNTGSTILKGTLVSASGAEPSGRIDVEPFAAVGGINSELTVMGMATANISNGVNGEVISFGTLTGLDTRGNTVSAIAVGDETWAEGDILFAHPTVAGKLTKIRPQHDLAVAFITVRHASTGQIAVRIIPGNNHLEWMHDVLISGSVQNNELLSYDLSNGVWINKTADEAGISTTSHNHTLDSLSNVDINSLNDGDAIIWSSASSAWINQVAQGGATTTVSETAPATPSTGDSWYKPSNGSFFIYDGSYWVEVTSVITMSDEEAQDKVAPLFDHANHINITASYDDANNQIILTSSATPDLSAYLTASAAATTYQPLNGALTTLSSTFGNTTIQSGIVKFANYGMGMLSWSLDTNTYLTSESDTLETVTDRGATSSNAITISNTTQSTTPTTGALIISGGLGIAKDVWIDGDLHVNGTTVTENTKTVAAHDNLIYLNAALDSTITNAVFSSGSITYTAENLYTAGMDIRITGVDPAGFNISTGDNLTVASATPTQFIVVKSDPGASYVSGGISHAKEEANPDLGFAGGYYNAGYAHAGLFRDASDGVFKFFQGYTPEPDEAVNIDTTHASFALANIAVGDLEVNGGDITSSASTVNLFSGGSNQNISIGFSSVSFTDFNLENYLSYIGTSLASATNRTTFNHDVEVTGAYGNFIAKNGFFDYITVKNALPYSIGGTGLTTLGTAGQILTVNTGATGLEWADASGGSSFTNSSELAALLSDETGSGSVVFSNSPTFTGTVNLPSNSATGMNANNSVIYNVGALHFNDPGPDEGIFWLGGNGWKIYESPNDLTTNSAGNLQFVQNTTSRMLLDTSGDMYVAKSGIFGNSTITTQDVALKVGFGRTGTGNAYLDLVGDTTNTDFGLRVLRSNGGVNSNSWIQHAGTGSFHISTPTGDIKLLTNGITRFSMSNDGTSAFTGTVSGPTATFGTNTTQLATTAFVQSAVKTIPIIAAKTGTYVLALGDEGDLIECNGTFNVNIPTDTVAFPIGTQITILNIGTGVITIGEDVPATTTLNGTPGLKLRAQWSSATLIKRAAQTWVAVGDLTA
jgi:hypothetical protein